MSAPRQIIPKATYLITRRVILRQMLLRPDPLMTQILLYVLAVSARRCGIEVHAFCAMSTHIHLVVTDVRGELPKFLHCFHRIVSLCVQVYRCWKGGLWDKEPTSVVRLETMASIVEKTAYVLANPVSAGLVQHAHEWPGAKVLVDEIGKGVLRASRPTVYLNPKKPEWTAEATLPISLPPSVAEEYADVFRRQVAAELDRLETQAHATRAEQGRCVLGAERSSEVSAEARATSTEPVGERNPTFAVGRDQGDAWHRAAVAVRAFRTSYRAALEQWRKNEHNAVFPMGTWWMRVFHGALVNSVVMAV